MPRTLPRWLPAALVVLALTATAAPIIVLGGGFTPGGTQPGPGGITYEILQPDSCLGCHGDYVPGPWRGSMMANAARDPLFWAALDVANNDVPGVGDFCLRCHVPQGWLAGRSSPTKVEPGVDGCRLQGPIDSNENDFEGVSCHFCHRMMVNDTPPMGELPFYTENAAYWIDDVPCTTPGGSGSEPCRRGPYAYDPLDPNDPPPTAPHVWAHSPYHRSSTFCGNCHDVTSPAQTLKTNTGVDTGIPYPIERTYSEWTQSAFADIGDPGAATCQECHMPRPTVSPTYASIFESHDRVGNSGYHDFVGANTWIPAVLRDEYPNLFRDDAFNETIAATLDLLQNYTAEIEVDLTPTGPAAVEANVRVTNLAGHKLPTGYTEGRRMWIHLEVRDADNNVVFESGVYNVETATLIRDAQAKVYETERGIWNRNGTNQCDVLDAKGNHIFHFVLNDCIRLDNRIPPRGFTPDIETEPVGYTYPEVSGSPGVLQHWDDTTYTFAIPSGTRSPLSVTATLRHQIAPRDYVEFLRNQAVANSFPDDCIERSSGLPAGKSRGELLYDMWMKHGQSPPTTLVSDVATIDMAIFRDGFETGTTSAWSATVP